jgi:hypothetical protein
VSGDLPEYVDTEVYPEHALVFRERYVNRILRKMVVA